MTNDIRVILQSPEYITNIQEEKYNFQFSQCKDPSFKFLTDTPNEYINNKWKLVVVDENEKWLIFTDLWNLKYKGYIEKTVASEETTNKEDYDFTSFMDFVVWYKTEFEPKMATWTHLNVKLEWWTHLIWYDERTSATIPLAYKTLFYFSLADIEFNWPSDDNRAVIQIKNDDATNEYVPNTVIAPIDSTVQTYYVDFCTWCSWYSWKYYSYLLQPIRSKLSMYYWYLKDWYLFNNVKSYLYLKSITIDNADSWLYYNIININNCYAALDSGIVLIWKYWLYNGRMSSIIAKNVDTSWLTEWLTRWIPINEFVGDGSIIVDSTEIPISYKNKEETITAKKTHSDDIEINDSAKWIIITSPWWTKYRIKVDEDWVLLTESI